MQLTLQQAHLLVNLYLKLPFRDTESIIIILDNVKMPPIIVQVLETHLPTL